MNSFLIIPIVLLLILVSSIFAGDCDYNYDGGPLSWSRDYPACNGNFQSPININPITNPRGAPNLYMNNNINYYTVKNNHTIEVIDLEQKNYITFNGVDFTFKQVHFHTPSEHHINGIHYDAEAHFVFEYNNNPINVVAVLYKVNSWGFSSLLNSIPHPPKGVAWTFDYRHKLTVDVSSELSSIIASQPYNWAYWYTGSLTTPPCNDGSITWWVAATIMPISVDQLNRLRDLIGYNSRPIQPKRELVWPAVN